QVVPAVAAELGTSVVAATADFGPYGAARDRAVAAALAAARRELRAVDSPYLLPPGTLRGAGGRPYRVFGAFRRALDRAGCELPVARPRTRFVAAAAGADVLSELERSEPAPAGSHGIPDWWDGLPLGAAEELPQAGPAAAAERLRAF